MSSAIKTLELLSLFAPARPEIGLSQMCRLAGHDKATTYRYLQALEAVGFVEQNSLTKQYRLGPALMQLAQIREATVLRKEGARMAMNALADATGETAHVSVLSGTTVFALASCESPKHATRAVVDIATFPLHATASGLCALAFGPNSLFEVASGNLEVFTENTAATATELSQRVSAARDCGFGLSDGSFEAEVSSLSAPIFDQTGSFAGAISVASVASRFTTELENRIKVHLVAASREISRNWGGTVPPSIEAAWARSLSRSNGLEATP